jgi:hypothetical protein
MSGKPSGNPAWVKGVSGNPSGRPKIPQAVRDLARQHTELAIECLVKATKKGSITAAGMLLDRGWGRPEINVDLRMLFEKKLIELTEEELVVLRERMIASSATAPPVIEHHEDAGDVGLDVGTEGDDAEYSE